ncbi:thioredoxin family protein [Sulfurimonas sp.]
MAIIEVDESNFNEVVDEAFEADKTVVLKFGSILCDGCMVQAMELEELDEIVDNLVILEIDLGESESLAHQFEISEVPTTIIYKTRDDMIFHKKGIILAADIKKIVDEKRV